MYGNAVNSHFFADGPFYTHLPLTAGNNGTNVNVTVGLMANPQVKTFNWTRNGTKLSDSSNLKLMPGELRFMPLLVGSDEGKYVVTDCNNISCSSTQFTFDVYCKFWAEF